MKTRLPKTLLAALLAAISSAPAVYAHNGYVPTVQITGAEEDVLTTLQQQLLEGSSSTTPKVIYKDGTDQPLTISSNITMHNPLAVREGTMKIISGAKVTYEQPTALSSSVSGLLVGGKNASLEVNNGSYHAKGSSADIAIGNPDGAGHLVISNGGKVNSDHYIYAGYGEIKDEKDNIRTGGGYYAGSGYSGGDTGVSTILITDEGSTLGAGTSFQFANAEVTVTNGGSMSDNTRNRGAGNNITWPESYFGNGINSNTVVNVTTNEETGKGGTLDLNWDLYTSKSKNSNTEINVSGTGSTMSVAGMAYLSMVNDYNDATSNTTNTDATTSLKITDGATADIAGLMMGIDAGQAEVLIGKGSTYTGNTIKIGGTSTFTNEGTVTLETRNITDWVNQQDTVDIANSPAKLEMTGGSIINKGTLTVKGDTIVTGATTRSASTSTGIATEAGGVTNLEGNITGGTYTTANGTENNRTETYAELKGDGNYKVIRAAHETTLESSVTAGGTLNIGSALVDGATFESGGKINFTGTEVTITNSTLTTEAKSGSTTEFENPVAVEGTYTAQNGRTYDNAYKVVEVEKKYTAGSMSFDGNVTTSDTSFTTNGDRMTFNGNVTANNGSTFETVKGTMNFKADVTANTGSSFVLNGSTINGTMTINGGELAHNSGTMTVNTLSLQSGAATFTGGTTNVTKLEMASGAVSQTRGTLNVSDVEITGGTLNHTNGALNITSGGSISNANINHEIGTFNISGEVELNGNTLDVNGGNMNITADASLTGNTINQNSTGSNLNFEGTVQLNDGNTITSTNGTVAFLGETVTATGENTFKGGVSFNSETKLIVSENATVSFAAVDVQNTSTRQVMNFGAIQLENGATVSIDTSAQNSGVTFAGEASVTDLTIGDRTTVTVDDVLTAGTVTFSDTVDNLGGDLIVNANMTVNSALTLGTGNDITLNNSIVTSNSLTIGEGAALTLFVNDPASTGFNVNQGGSVTIADGVSVELYFSDALINEVLNMGENEGKTIDLSAMLGVDEGITADVDFSKLEYNLGIVGGAAGSYVELSAPVAGADGSFQMTLKHVPEPATATLSLLALAGLAARRRRR